MKENKSNVTINIQGGNNQILPNTTMQYNISMATSFCESYLLNIT